MSLRHGQIAVHEAVPYEECKQNPHTVICTTSLGGHLSWFQLGGGRWHAHPVGNFLQNMAAEIDLDAIKSGMNGSTVKNMHGAVFNPVRRKLLIHTDQQDI